MKKIRTEKQRKKPYGSIEREKDEVECESSCPGF